MRNDTIDSIDTLEECRRRKKQGIGGEEHIFIVNKRNKDG